VPAGQPFNYFIFYLSQAIGFFFTRPARTTFSRKQRSLPAQLPTLGPATAQLYYQGLAIAKTL